jgi:hypothetical protein
MARVMDADRVRRPAWVLLFGAAKLKELTLSFAQFFTFRNVVQTVREPPNPVKVHASEIIGLRSLVGYQFAHTPYTNESLRCSRLPCPNLTFPDGPIQAFFAQACSI